MPRVVPSQVVEFIDSFFPDASTMTLHAGITNGLTPVLEGLLDLMDEIPSELFVLSGAEYARMVAAKGAIRHQLSIWATGTTAGVVPVVPNAAYHPIGLVRNALAMCPDSAPAAGIAGLEFVDDEGLRGQLRVDMTEAFDAERNGDWKSAMVLAGSVIEALLLWSLEKFTRDQINAAYPETTKGRLRDLDPKEWTLGPYIGAAHALALIDDDTRDQARLAQNFRNLIHPGRAARLGEQCNRGTSLGALAGMERVASALAARFPRST